MGLNRIRRDEITFSVEPPEDAPRVIPTVAAPPRPSINSSGKSTRPIPARTCQSKARKMAEEAIAAPNPPAPSLPPPLQRDITPAPLSQYEDDDDKTTVAQPVPGTFKQANLPFQAPHAPATQLSAAGANDDEDDYEAKNAQSTGKSSKTQASAPRRLTTAKTNSSKSRRPTQPRTKPRQYPNHPPRRGGHSNR